MTIRKIFEKHSENIWKAFGKHLESLKNTRRKFEIIYKKN